MPPTYYGGPKQDVTAGTIFRFSGTVRNLTESGVVTADEAQRIVGNSDLFGVRSPI